MISYHNDLVIGHCVCIKHLYFLVIKNFSSSEFQKIAPNVSLQLLEYDKRFEQYGSYFTFYDYNQPEELPPDLKHAFQVVVADPPYLVRTWFVLLDANS